ncbi:hypothetical protein E2C01_083963 [Portunus trituberculatus]|uniref:Uncharacterized protein n=1 Tax=Portunus trituberculatus TaxID=210409 RepID=A0A5B7J2R8_PORTR|nr:hypothetical protein [Portunus trituberculatus]
MTSKEKKGRGKPWQWNPSQVATREEYVRERE